MRRQRENVFVEIRECEYLPPEMWREILSFLSIRDRYRCASVCVTFGQPKGLIDQSVTVLPYRENYHGINLSNLVNLTSLGVYPDRVVFVVPHFKHIRSLVLESRSEYHCSTRVLSQFKNLTALEIGMYVKIPLQYLKSLPCLTKLTLRSAFLMFGPKGVCYLQPLNEEINILTSLTALVELDLCDTRLRNEHIREMTQLRQLSLSYNTSIDGQGISVLTRLNHLSLDHQTILAHEIRPLTSLLSLSLNHINSIQSDALTHLTALRSLALYAMRCTQKSDILRQCTLLTRLSLLEEFAYEDEENKLRRAIGNLRSLRYLELTCYNIKLLREIDILSLTNLTKLHIDSLVDFPLTRLTNLTNLHLDVPEKAIKHGLCAELFPLSIRKLKMDVYSDEMPFVSSLLIRLVNVTKLSITIVGGGYQGALWRICTFLKSLKRVKCGDVKTARQFLPHVEVSAIFT